VLIDTEASLQISIQILPEGLFSSESNSCEWKKNTKFPCIVQKNAAANVATIVHATSLIT